MFLLVQCTSFIFDKSSILSVQMSYKACCHSQPGLFIAIIGIIRNHKINTSDDCVYPLFTRNKCLFSDASHRVRRILPHCNAIERIATHWIKWVPVDSWCQSDTSWNVSRKKRCCHCTRETTSIHFYFFKFLMITFLKQCKHISIFLNFHIKHCILCSWILIH